MPWIEAPALAPELFREIRLETVFECFKWDPQVGDVATLADFPLVLAPEAWREIATAAERLAAECLELERELAERPDLRTRLGLPPRVLRLTRGATAEAVQTAARVVRFDFHFTTEGWRISEANADVPGGYNEASGFTRLVARHYAQARPTGDPALALAEAVAATAGDGALVALVYATAHSEDRQVMELLARSLAEAGLRTCFASPEHVRWRDGRAFLDEAWCRAEVGAIVRYFPAEWLATLPRRRSWPIACTTASCNPLSALFAQSKRAPLVWDALRASLPAWRELLPETRDPRDVPADDDAWVLKPALGRVGESVGIAGVTDRAELETIRRRAARRPAEWVAQRRFEAVPLETPDGPVYPCVGVYTVNGRAAGAYGRLGARPLVEAHAKDVTVLVGGAKEEP